MADSSVSHVSCDYCSSSIFHRCSSIAFCCALTVSLHAVLYMSLVCFSSSRQPLHLCLPPSCPKAGSTRRCWSGSISTACKANSKIDLGTSWSSSTASLRSVGMSCSPVPLRAGSARARACARSQQLARAPVRQRRRQMLARALTRNDDEDDAEDIGKFFSSRARRAAPHGCWPPPWARVQAAASARHHSSGYAPPPPCGRVAPACPLAGRPHRPCPAKPQTVVVGAHRLPRPFT